LSINLPSYIWRLMKAHQQTTLWRELDWRSRWAQFGLRAVCLDCDS
jgi:hypothetical protein